MKTTKRNIILICLLAIASVVHAEEYKPFTNSATAMPSTQFQSTSIYLSQLEPKKSTLNTDGTVKEAAYVSGPKRIGGTPTPGGGGTNGPGTPGNPEDENQQPLGDAIIPLMLLALAYMAIRVYRRRKA